MLSDTQAQQFKKMTGWSIELGVLMIIAGIFAVSLPFSFSLSVAIWLGWLFIFVGSGNLIYAWQTRDEDWLVLALKLFIAILYLSTGIFFVVNPIKGVLTLTLALAAFLIIEGISELLLAFRVRSLSSSWKWVLAHGIITLSLGIAIWSGWPGTSAWVIGLLVGINLISGGVSRIVLSSAARAALRTN